MKKRILSFIVIIAMFLLIASIDTIENTSDIASAQKQAQINKESRCK